MMQTLNDWMAAALTYKRRLEEEAAKTSYYQRIAEEMGRKYLREVESLSRIISELKHAQAVVQKSEERYRLLTENMRDLICLHTPDGRFSYVSPSVSELLGYLAQELVGSMPLDIIHPDDAEQAVRVLKRKDPADTSEKQAVYRMRNTAGQYRWFECLSKTVVNAAGEIVAIQSASRDITDRKNSEEALRKSEKKHKLLSITDGLTHLFNTRHFYRRLRSEIDRSLRYGHPLSLLLLDVDDFKVFNDTYGHLEGDKVLSGLARIFIQCIRQTDSAYRYGGEEFIILLPDTVGPQAVIMGERIQTRIREHLFSPNPDTRTAVTVSMGVAEYRPGEEMALVVKRVDQNMYMAKQQGKDRLVFA